MKKSFFAEFVGTFFLIFVSGAIVILNRVNTKIDYACVAMTFSLILGCCYAIFHGFSGAHFNPAISFAYYITGRMTTKELIMYIVGQFAGGLLACVLLLVVFANKFDYFVVSVNRDILKYDDLSAGTVVFIFEFIFSFMLAFAYMIFDKHTNTIGCSMVLAGGYFAMCAVLIYVDGCGLNLIRIAVPALLYNKWFGVIHYVVAVSLGCLCGGISYTLLSHRVHTS